MINVEYFCQVCFVNFLFWTDISCLGGVFVKNTSRETKNFPSRKVLRNSTQVIIRHRVKILFSFISSSITLKRQKWKSSKMKGTLLSSPVSCISCLLVKRGGSLSFLTIFTFVVPELLDLIWRKIGFLPYVVTTQVIVRHRICLQTDGRTDGQTWWNQYTPLQLHCGGYNDSLLEKKGQN
jgi:hypothetical protein